MVLAVATGTVEGAAVVVAVVAVAAVVAVVVMTVFGLKVPCSY